MVKTEVPIEVTSELKELFDSANKALTDACDLTLKQSIPEKQLVFMTNARLRSAGNALMMRDNPDRKIESKRKMNALVAFGSKSPPPPTKLKKSFFYREVLTIYMEISRVRTNSLRSNKANICSDRQQIRHTFAGSVKTATDFPSRVELKITVKIGLKIRLDIQTKIIEVTTSSSDVADEEHFFLTQADNKNYSKKTSP